MNDLWPISEQRVTACGISTRVLQGGANDRATEAVVFVHGNPGSCEDWRHLMARVAPQGRVIALDMPGFGQADKPADYPYSVEAGATFLGETLQKLGVWRAHLVLHDFGGPWGLAWAAMNPMGLASLTLVNTGLMLNYRWHLMARIWRTPVLGELQQMLTTRRGFHWALNLGQRKPLPREFIDRMYQDLDKGTKRAILKLYRATGHLSQRSEMLGRLLKPLNPPTLVIWGEADPYLPVRLANEQATFFPRAEIHRLPDSGHFPFADDPEGVAQALLPFLSRQLSNRPPGPG